MFTTGEVREAVRSVLRVLCAHNNQMCGITFMMHVEVAPWRCAQICNMCKRQSSTAKKFECIAPFYANVPDIEWWYKYV